MAFDVRTLLVAVALAMAFCAGARFLLWRMHPTMPGLLHWAWASVLGALALLLFAAHGVLPGVVALSLGQALLAGGLGLAWVGHRRFLGRPPLRPRTVALLTAVALGAIGVADAADSLPLRTIVNTAVVGGLSALCARELLRAAGPQRTAMWVTGWIYVGNTLALLIRGVVAARGGVPVEVPLTSTDSFAYSLLWGLCSTLGVTLGMVLMAGERLQEELNHHATRDPLTGTLNRRAFGLLAERQAAQAVRTGRSLSVLMMDLDHFKRINDQLGHAGGDAVLRHFVAVAREILRAEDSLCRFGGEEFVVLLPDTDGTQALAAAERLRRTFAASGHTVSIGIAALAPTETVEDLLRRADASLYEAKRLGRDRCEMAAPAPAEARPAPLPA
ncbi:diguanylate cyclase [Novispirillum sp. DQ9]|uniref:GGDEF domain-containing protein n=1 Tax=Novispirillum sp. DQ9 TaxID=3398612 RepID=UPI003C79FC26